MADKDDLHKEFRTLVMLLQLVTTITNGDANLFSNLNTLRLTGKQQFTNKDAFIHRTVLEAIANLLVRTHDILAVTGAAVHPANNSELPTSSDSQVENVPFPIQDAPYMDFTSIPLVNFVVVNNPHSTVHYPGFAGGIDLLFIHGQSVWIAIIKNSWHGLTMG